MSDLTNRDLRQRDIVPPTRLAKCRATIIGVGAIGRQAALQLAAMGLSQLQLIDFDLVETVNLGPQAYLEADVGRMKVDATADLCRQLNSAMHIEACPHRFRRSMPVGNILFCCVDAITTRRAIWNAVRDRVALFIDGRMSAEVVRVLTASDSLSRAHYPTTLFSAAEAHAGPCAAKATVYAANVAAGLMISQFTRWLRDLPTDPDFTLNLLASELTLPPSLAA